MSNNMNHTEKDMEQLITETLDRCMSGIDTALSLRPVVDKKLAENPAPAKRHIPVRQLVLPAAALVCALVVFFGIRMNSASRPDPVTAAAKPATFLPCGISGYGRSIPKTAASPPPAISALTMQKATTSAS